MDPADETKPPTKPDHPRSAKSIRLTVEQREMFERAYAKVQAMAGGPKLSEGQALEFLVADWLSGN